MVGTLLAKSKIAPESPWVVLFQVWRKHCAADPDHHPEFGVFALKTKEIYEAVQNNNDGKVAILCMCAPYHVEINFTVLSV